MDKLMKVILEKYKIDYKRIYDAQSGYRNKCFLIETNDNQNLNLIIYKKERGILQKILNANEFAHLLSNNDLPVRKPLAKIIKIKEDYYTCLYNYLPGETIPWASYTKKHLKLMGSALNQIHASTLVVNDELKIKGKDQAPLGVKGLQRFPSESENLRNCIIKMLEYFQSDDVTNAISQKLSLKINFINFLKESLILVDKIDNLNSKVLLHMDFVRGNILFTSKPNLNILGIIDFEKSAYGSPIFDLARTLAFLFVDCKYKNEGEVRRYFLKSGYIKHGKFKLKSFEYLNQIVLIYLIYDLYKFLKHNPYEFLLSNEHFTRTKDLLTKSKLLLN